MQICTLMQELPKDKFEQLLVYGKCKSNEIDYLESNQVTVPSLRLENLGRSISPFQDFVALVAIWRLIRRLKPDIVHTHTFKAGLLGRLATIPLVNRPIVIHTFHGHLLHGYFGFLKTRLVVFAERYLASISDALVAVGEKIKLDLLDRKIGKSTKYRVIRPGFNLREVHKVDRLQLGIDDSDFVCCWVGRLTKIKSPHRILEIAEELKSLGTQDVKFLVVGDGELREDLEREVNSRSLPIKFVGWRANSTDYIAMSELLLLTSENEGTPIAVIEAQQLGKPVLATNVGSVGEVMIPGKTGYLLDYDVEAFCQQILHFKKDLKEYGEFQLRSKEFADSEFSTKRFILDYEKLYTDLSRL